jgi:hypothetical protein
VINRRGWVVVILSALVLIGVCVRARADEPKLPAGYSCVDVRRVVDEVGKVRALVLAVEHGATWAQIKAARACLNAK